MTKNQINFILILATLLVLNLYINTTLMLVGLSRKAKFPMNIAAQGDRGDLKNRLEKLAEMQKNFPRPNQFQPNMNAKLPEVVSNFQNSVPQGFKEIPMPSQVNQAPAAEAPAAQAPDNT